MQVTRNPKQGAYDKKQITYNQSHMKTKLLIVIVVAILEQIEINTEIPAKVATTFI